jgi:DNA-directed RNA polymerase specialized sigma24 family protein
MAIEIAVPPGPQRTRALLEEIAGGRRGVQLRGQVAAVKRGATREQIEEAFQEACLKATRSCRGQTIGEVYKWLLKTTDSLVDDMRDRLKREVLVDHGATAFETVDPSLAPPDEVLIKREERAELDQLSVAILERLDERSRKVAVLHSHGLARNDIARHLGITPRVVKRNVEGILATGRDQLTRVAGSGCPDGHALVSRYAFGLAAGREARRAQLHLAGCARCGGMFERLDLWRERVAALMPVPPAVEAHTHIAEHVVHLGADALSSPRPAGLRRHVADVMGHVREHAMAAYYRTVDPSALAGVRPGAVAAAVAGCLAVGGGATYCVHQGVDPLGGIRDIAMPAHAKDKAKPHHRKARAAQAQAQTTPVVITTVAPPPVTTPATSTAPQTQSTSTSATTTTQAAPPPAPQDEYEPDSGPTGGAASTGTSEGAPAKTTKPAPAPASGPSEFDGP